MGTKEMISRVFPKCEIVKKPGCNLFLIDGTCVYGLSSKEHSLENVSEKNNENMTYYFFTTDPKLVNEATHICFLLKDANISFTIEKSLFLQNSYNKGSHGRHYVTILTNEQWTDFKLVGKDPKKQIDITTKRQVLSTDEEIIAQAVALKKQLSI